MKEGWTDRKLGDLCHIELGKTPYRGDSSYWDVEKKSKNVWLCISDLLNTDGVFVSNSKEYLTDKGASISKIVKKGTLLLSFKLTIGRLAFAGRDIYTNEAIAALTIKDEKKVDKNYLYWFLSFYDWDQATLGDVKIKGKTLNKAKLKDINICYPESIAEQQRIVAVLDEVFAATERAKANIEKNLQNAKDLFQSELDYIFSQKGEDWEEKKLGDIATISYGFTEKASFEKIGPKFLRITDITETGIDWNSVPYCRCDDKDLIKYRLETGDILFARTGATTGKSFLILVPPVSIYASYLIRVKVNNREIILPELVSRYFQTKDYWNKINEGMTGSAQGGFNASKIGNLEISYPKARREQEVIIKRLDALSAETKRLEENYRKQLANLEELKKSVLEKAFSGELT